jgi:hypothetical protein
MIKAREIYEKYFDFAIKVFLITIGAIIVAVILGGLYEIQPAGGTNVNPFAYKLNRITGKVWICSPLGCIGVKSK